MYLNLLDKLFLDWKVAACPEIGAAAFGAEGIIPAGAHGWAVTLWWTEISRNKSSVSISLTLRRCFFQFELEYVPIGCGPPTNLISGTRSRTLIVDLIAEFMDRN